MWSSWKLETSRTAVAPSRQPATASANAVPMLPATTSGRRAVRNTWATSEVVVVFPLLPVMATIGLSQNHDATSISE